MAKMQVWNGSAWVNASSKVWNGSSWVTGKTNVWDGSTWVALANGEYLTVSNGGEYIRKYSSDGTLLASGYVSPTDTITCVYYSKVDKRIFLVGDQRLYVLNESLQAIWYKEVYSDTGMQGGSRLVVNNNSKILMWSRIDNRGLLIYSNGNVETWLPTQTGQGTIYGAEIDAERGYVQTLHSYTSGALLKRSTVEGAVVDSFTVSTPLFANSMCFDNDGYLIVALTSVIYKYDSRGSLARSPIDSVSLGTGWEGYGLCADKENNIYIFLYNQDGSTPRLRKYNSNLDLVWDKFANIANLIGGTNGANASFGRITTMGVDENYLYFPFYSGSSAQSYLVLNKSDGSLVRKHDQNEVTFNMIPVASRNPWLR